jgi:hypothetical protein
MVSWGPELRSAVLRLVGKLPNIVYKHGCVSIAEQLGILAYICMPGARLASFLLLKIRIPYTIIAAVKIAERRHEKRVQAGAG